MIKLDRARAFLVCTTALFAWGVSPAQAPPSRSVSNGTHKVEVTSVEKTHTIMGNVVPRTPGADFLMFSLVTDDPCFDTAKNTSCFSAAGTTLDKVRLACGQVATAGGKIYEADGGGLIGGKVQCGFVVPAETSGTVKLRLKGYPDLSLEVGASPPATDLSSQPIEGSSQLPALPTPKPAPEMERLSRWLAGKWETVEWRRPDSGVPPQQVGKGQEAFTVGPGGLSLLSQYRAQRDAGPVFESLGFVYWNPEKNVYERISCSNANPKGCALEGTGKWEGSDLVFYEEFKVKDGKIKLKTVYTDIKPASFTNYWEASLENGPPGPRWGVYYRKISESAVSPPSKP